MHLVPDRVQPAASADVARLGEIADADGPVPVLLITAPARVSWLARFTEHAELEGSVGLVPAPGPAAAGVTIRIGISDGRTYDGLSRLSLDAPRGVVAWQAVRIDLGAYGGRKFSLFYRPSYTTWSLVIAVDPTPAGTVAWRTLRLQKK